MNKLAFDAVVFDLDGTLIDSAPDVIGALNAVLAEEALAPVGLATGRRFIGEGGRVLIKRALRFHDAPAGEQRVARMVRRFVEIYRADPVTHTRLYPGVRATLARLGRSGLALGVCTNKPDAATEAVLAALDLAPCFAAVVGGDIARRKPDGAHLGAVLDRLGTAPARAAYVGDTATDVAAARAAGTAAIVVSYGYSQVRPSALRADLVVARFADLPRALARLPRRRPASRMRAP